jgi:exosortase A-associated hydrolase 2
VLFVHPFAEEINKCRRMAALQSRAFADAGWLVLQIDLYGCGDSAGDFAEATWDRWVDDVLQAVEWLRASTGYAPVLWGLRAGCLIAAQAAQALQYGVDLVLWQPAISGRQVLQQFLRVEVVGQILGEPGTQRMPTQQLRAQLVQGETIEVAGYTVSPGVALGLEAADLNLPPGLGGRTAWLEISGVQGGELSPAARTRIDAWQAAGRRVDARVVEGTAFWRTQEVTECPALIQATLALVDGWRA